MASDCDSVNVVFLKSSRRNAHIPKPDPLLIEKVQFLCLNSCRVSVLLRGSAQKACDVKTSKSMQKENVLKSFTAFQNKHLCYYNLEYLVPQITPIPTSAQ